MGIDWEEIFGDENSENFEDHFTGDESYGYEEDAYYDELYEDELPFEEVDPAQTAKDALDSNPLADYADRPEDLKELARTAGYLKLSNYILTCLKNVNPQGKNITWKDSGNREHPIFAHLFHANSVMTAVDYIRNKCIYSRQYGDTERQGVQTQQWSDDIDKMLGIYNDIFFDSMDIASGQGYSVYGPVVFVFDIAILDGKTIRVTKNNPAIGVALDQLKYKDLFYTSKDEFRDDFIDNMEFVRNYGHHVTAFDQDYLRFETYLKAIYIEKCYDGSGMENDLKDLILTELNNAGIANVDVVIRPGSYVPEASRVKSSNELSELWRFPD